MEKKYHIKNIQHKDGYTTFTLASPNPNNDASMKVAGTHNKTGLEQIYAKTLKRLNDTQGRSGMDPAAILSPPTGSIFGI